MSAPHTSMCRLLLSASIALATSVLAGGCISPSGACPGQATPGGFDGVYVIGADLDARLQLSQEGDRLRGSLRAGERVVPLVALVRGGTAHGWLVMGGGERLAFHARVVAGELELTLAARDPATGETIEETASYARADCVRAGP